MSPPDPRPLPLHQLRQHFAALDDPRIERTKAHPLLDLLTIAICAVICGAENWTDMEEFGNAKRRFFEQFLTLPNGIPAHDTFGRVFARRDPQQFQACFLAWVQDVVQLSAGQIVAVDGKTRRGAADKPNGKAAIHMVSAWASGNEAGLVLGQRKVEGNSNEITAIPVLLQLLDLQGCIVTIDARGCQTASAQTIVDQQADYVLALKGNQGRLHADGARLFGAGGGAAGTGVVQEEVRTLDKGHGRLETRRYVLITDER